MAAGRGLNKGRGLGSLIPPKAAVNAADAGTASENNNTGISDGQVERKESPTYTDFSRKMWIKATTTGLLLSNNKEQNTTDEVVSVRLTEIVPNREQPRKRFDETGLEELAASIREHGVVTPLLVQKKGKYYELIAGERRWRAAKLAGLKTVPALIRDFSEQQAAEIALIENIQRENLNAMEEARAFKRLQEEFSLKQEEIAERVSRSRSAITNALRLLKLEEHVQTMLAEGTLSMGHARALLSLEDLEMQKKTAEQVAANDLSVRETEKLVKQLLNPKKTREKPKGNEQLEAVYHDLEESLKKAIGTRVAIHPLHGKKGKIEIEYYSDEDLERIIDRLQQN